MESDANSRYSVSELSWNVEYPVGIRHLENWLELGPKNCSLIGGKKLLIDKNIKYRDKHWQRRKINHKLQTLANIETKIVKKKKKS